jgi:hypothetical protein
LYTVKNINNYNRLDPQNPANSQQSQQNEKDAYCIVEEEITSEGIKRKRRSIVED